MKVINDTAINYFGITIYIPEEAKWVATDKDGTVCWYKYKPYLIDNWWDTKFEYEKVCSVDLEGVYWKDTLFQVE